MIENASSSQPEANPGPKLAGVYRWLATTLLTTLLLFAAANLVAALLLGAGVSVPEPGPLRYGLKPLRAAYRDRSDEEIRELLTEFWTRPYAYEPFTEFRDDAFNGRHLHILPEGFRSVGHPQPWPPDEATRTVFVFGGSTAMGYGVGDAETLPARLEAELAAAPCGPISVYNFARSSYFSSQERILFQQLALAGAVPDLAVFFDGLNEFAYPIGEPKFAPRLRYLMAETGPQLARRLLVRLPLARLVKGLWGGEDDALTSPGDPARLGEEVVERWLVNRRLSAGVAASLGTATLFVWQPVPVYQSTPSANPFLGRPGSTLPNQAALVEGYRLLDRRRESGTAGLGADVLWLADRQRGATDALYVDRAHYSPAFAAELARALAPAAAARLCVGSTGAESSLAAAAGVAALQE